MNNKNRDKLLLKIDLIEENLKKLKELQKISREEFKEDFRNIEACKYLLQTSIEIMIDMANMIIALQRLGKPETNAEAFEILASNGIISEDSKEKYIVMTKFRNRIVHMYDKVDDSEIYDILQNSLSDFESFIKEILSQI